MKKTVTITALALVFAASAYAQQGHKETDRLIKRAEEMKKDLETATVQVGKTMDYYNAIMKVAPATRASCSKTSPKLSRIPASEPRT